MPAAISCVTIPVDDLKKSIAFYRDVMGFAVDDQDEMQVTLDADGVYLVLLERSEFGVYVESVGHRPASRGNAEVLLSYFTESKGEVDSLLAKAKGAGATTSSAEEDEGSYSGYFTDPDGHTWEVLFDGE
jgi:predicted lactoylglutathione lyase